MSSQFQKSTQKINSIVGLNNNELLKTLPLIVSNNTTPEDSIIPIVISEDLLNSAVLKKASDLNPNNIFFIGTSTLSFEFDINENKMKIDSCHLPIYDGINGNKIIDILPENSGYNFATQNSGIFITNLEPRSFWFNKLGFTSDIYPSFKSKVFSGRQEPAVHAINGPIIYPESLEEGKYTTGLYLGLDILIPKSYPNTTNTPTTPSQAISYNGQKAQSLKPTIATTNNPIYATNPINAVGAPSGYFLIEVSGINASTNEMIGQNYSNPQIKGIVSRYYTVNSYTSAGMESDIPFENLGPEPVYINSLNVRILNPDGTLATNIDGDNTIFLQVNRKQPLDPLITNNPKNDKNDKNDK